MFDNAIVVPGQFPGPCVLIREERVRHICAEIDFMHFDVHVFDEGKFLAPVVTWGKYEAEGDKVLMPLSMNIHHAVADGFHLSRFFNEVQEEIDRLAHRSAHPDGIRVFLSQLQ